jgi:hypothetical protein
MGKFKFVTVMVPAAALLAALSLPAAAQQAGAGAGARHVAPAGKGAPARAAPVQRGPMTGAGARPVNRQAVRPGVQPGAHVGGPGRPGYAGRPAYAGRPGYAGRSGYYARYPGFARRSFGGRFYRGNLAWERGSWRHEWRNGRYGWWWGVGGAWYFYDRPYDGPPTYISDVEFLEDPAMADVGPPEDAPPPGAYAPEPVVVAPPPAVVVVPPPIVCVGPLCVR